MGEKGWTRIWLQLESSFCLIPWRPPERSLHHGGHLALKLGGLTLWTPMMASLGPQAMEATCLCACECSYLVEAATICSRGLPLSHGHLSREGSICELHGPTVPAARGKSLGALAGKKGLGRAPKPVLSHKTQKSFESGYWFINLSVPRDFASLYIPSYTFNWWRKQGKNQEQNSPAHPRSCNKDGVQATVSLFQRSASLLENITVTATANSISCPTIPHTVQSSSVTNRWHQKHPHLFQLIYALRIYWLKCQFPSTQISHVEKTLIALNPPPNLVTYSLPFAIWPLSWKVTWMWKKKKIGW